jgi:hypothetical protein
MTVHSIDDVRKRIRRHFPDAQAPQKPSEPLKWSQVTGDKYVSKCGSYVIQRGLTDGIWTVDAWLTSAKTDYEKLLGTTADGKAAQKLCQDHKEQAK